MLMEGGPSKQNIKASIATLIAEKEQNARMESERNARRIIAEDPEWNLAPVERLSKLCVLIIVKNFERI